MFLIIFACSAGQKSSSEVAEDLQRLDEESNGEVEQVTFEILSVQGKYAFDLFIGSV